MMPSQVHSPVVMSKPSGSIYLVPSMERASSDKATKYLFVNTVRFWSMAVIVALHCVNGVCGVYGSQGALQAAVTQPLKFGTIGFFLISGFLMGSRLEAYRPIEYLQRRLKRLVGPWIFWFVLFVVSMVAANVVGKSVPAADATLLLHDLASKVCFAIVYTPFWFVPNLVVGMICLLVCRRWIDDLRFGGILLAINLVYVVNLYAHWFRTTHTQALFGFVVYLWLGAWSARHIEAIQAELAGLPAWFLPSLTVLTCAGATLEAIFLQRVGGADPLNTLRITNQLFSVVTVMWMVRLKRASWPGSIDVPATTYGIHLVHIFAIASLVPALRYGMAHQLISTDRWMMVPTFLAAAGIAYGASLAVTRCLAAIPGMAWTVGVLAQSKTTGLAIEAGAVYQRPALGLMLNSQA